MSSRDKNQELINRLMRPELKLATVSGVVTTRPDTIKEFDLRVPAVEVITTKSYQLEPNPGNPEPVIVEEAVGNFGNSVGLRNPGMETGLAELRKLRAAHSMRALMNVSISGSTPEEFAQLAVGFEEVADILELNLSCPHAAEGYGMSIGTDPELVAQYVAAVRAVSDCLVFPKLTPNVDNIGTIARAAVEAGADGICAINTVGPRLFIEPHTGKPVLRNNRGNRGGMSGRWIADVARQKIAQIRLAVGPDIPILGIGGVESGEDVRRLLEAGANVVGIGSVFARVDPKNWSGFTNALIQDAAQNGDSAKEFVSERRVMEYRPFKIKRRESGGHGTVLLELDGKLDYQSSQFAFIWHPEVGEKPFSIAKNDPLSFFIKERGPVSGTLCALEPGETVYVRGVYGRAAPLSNKKHVYVLAGGTGIAVVPQLAKELAAKEAAVHVVYATSHKSDILVPEGIEDHARLDIVPDDGLLARAVGFWQHTVEENAVPQADLAVYTIGPPDFMRRTVETALELGAEAHSIFISVETATHCGVGLCGECECGGKLTCQEGTFFTKQFLDEQEIKIADLPSHEHHNQDSSPSKRLLYL
ncbi:MAG: dihydroorotate dehydrogenase [Spirochaetaceae bacterium]|nr:dihydroorotate dehydrogenase [Spirochaetaceae bacterium]MCF7948391.1 dihydroorotate dehydrogenase [Spirochaetia bacterium]MCF7951273.1 dihydroorotate dehydrogenase [Spirochaetaceae bacterium]